MLVRLLLLSCLLVTGCYTRLAMFHPDVEDETEEFYSYSVARVRPNLSLYANSGAGSSLSYSLMYSRFNRGYNNYDSYYLGGYRMYVPIYTTTYVPYISIDINKTPRSFSTDRNSNTSHTTNLNVTRTSSTSTSSNTSSQTKSARGARVTRRN